MYPKFLRSHAAYNYLAILSYWLLWMAMPAQANAQIDCSEPVFIALDETPKPEGGIGNFYKYVSEELKYPESALLAGIQGKVYVQFNVDEDGTLIDIKVVKGISEDCDAEAVRVIKNAPAWKPGKQRGRPVKVKMVIPILFRLS